MNRLAQSSSLYLKQHADNPVAWQPWDETALAEARATGHPILLSIGYSACHWCHVMAHESFEDEQTARWMNELFVNIKVDREERPDLDRIYQLSHQLLTGRGGGWPLTVFIDPEDLVPFFAGTYFPPEPRHGLPAFADLLRKVREWFDTHREEVSQQNQRLVEAVAGLQRASGETSPPGVETLDAVNDALGAHYDARHGGFGDAPKFPQAPLLALVQSIAGSGARHMLRESLTRMALSGLRDHLDGGFFRYTVDASWTIPHFEKMLYDNAMLLPLYAEEAAIAGDAFLAEAASGIVDWLQAEMRHHNGGFYASIDADADGREGGFHVWQRSEIEALLDAAEFAPFAAMYGLNQPPNFEQHSWHLLRHDADPGGAVPEQALRKLAQARSHRKPPTTDTKQLASWNALCIEGLARAGMVLGRPDWLDMAEQALQFVRSRLWLEGRLYAVYADGEPQFPAYLDDHAGLLHATLVLMQARWRPEYLELASCLAGVLLDRFADPAGGGFLFSAVDADVPVHRLRPVQDDALPSGNGVAARALLKLGHLTGDTQFLDTARRTLASASREIEDYPLAHASLLLALREYHDPPTQVIVTGTNTAEARALQDIALQARLGGIRLDCYALTSADAPLPGALAGMDHQDEAAAFVCHGLKCLPPFRDAAELDRALKETD